MYISYDWRIWGVCFTWLRQKLLKDRHSEAYIDNFIKELKDAPFREGNGNIVSHYDGEVVAISRNGDLCAKIYAKLD